MERGRFAPEGAQNFRMNRTPAEAPVQKNVDARGIYRGAKDVQVTQPEDLVDAGIRISYEAAAKTWGPEAASWYRQAIVAKTQGR
jgi:hypothetical protein